MAWLDRDQFGSEQPVLLGSEQQWLRLHNDYSNFMAALEWSWANGDHDAAIYFSAALSTYWYMTGHPEACEWMERTAAVPVSSSGNADRPGRDVPGRVGLSAPELQGRRRAGSGALIAEALGVSGAGNHPLRQDPGSHSGHRPRTLSPGHHDGTVNTCVGLMKRCRSRPSRPRRADCGRGRAWMALSAGDFDRAAQALEEPLRSRHQPDNRCASPTFSAAPRWYGPAPATHQLPGSAPRRSPRPSTSGPQVLVMALARAAEAAVRFGTNRRRPAPRHRAGRQPFGTSAPAAGWPKRWSSPPSSSATSSRTPALSPSAPPSACGPRSVKRQRAPLPAR